MDSMPIDFAEFISVQKSPHPARYSDTFGAVSVETRRRREQGYEGEIDLGYGRYNTFLSAGLKEGLVDAYGGLSYKYSEGTREHNTAILKSAFGRLGADLSEHEHIGFVHQRTESKVEDPGEKHLSNLHALNAGLLLNTRLALPLESVTPFDGELFVALENLTNDNYAYYPGYPIGGLMWYTGIKIKF